jgi:probable HAF family extracellular repeat protein
MVGLGDLPGGIFESGASSVSGDGSVIVGYGMYEGGYQGHQGFRWTAARGIEVVIPDPAFAGQPFGPNAVSADGSTVAGIVLAVPIGLEAARWSQATGVERLGDLAGGDFGSQAHAVSADGSVVVGDGASAAGYEAFRWTAAIGMVGLGDLPGGEFGSYARGISSDGSTVVGGSTSELGGEAFRWTEATGMVGLGDLPGGAFDSFANAVSADGSIIVGQGKSGTGFYDAVIWDAQHGMRSLREVLISEIGLGASLDDWHLDNATGISADGRTIVGEGRGPSGLEAWIAYLPNSAAVHVPEPSTALLAGMAGLGLLFVAHTRRAKR